jgi:hypothetical protein
MKKLLGYSVFHREIVLETNFDTIEYLNNSVGLLGDSSRVRRRVCGVLSSGAVVFGWLCPCGIYPIRSGIKFQ